jgi:antitoxin VapB
MQTAKLFQNGRSQAVRLPKEYNFEGTDVLIQKIGDSVILFPKNACGKHFSMAYMGLPMISWKTGENSRKCRSERVCNVFA